MEGINPRVWVTCADCREKYGDKAPGLWVDAEDAEDVEPADVHAEAADHEKLLVTNFCHVPAPADGSCTPEEAAEWGYVYNELGDLYPAFRAFAKEVYDTVAEVPSVAEFNESYQGGFDDRRDFARYIVEETDLMRGWPEEAIKHFDLDSYAWELRHDYVGIYKSDYMDGPEATGFWFSRR